VVRPANALAYVEHKTGGGEYVLVYATCLARNPAGEDLCNVLLASTLQSLQLPVSDVELLKDAKLLVQVAPNTRTHWQGALADGVWLLSDRWMTIMYDRGLDLVFAHSTDVCLFGAVQGTESPSIFYDFDLGKVGQYQAMDHLTRDAGGVDDLARRWQEEDVTESGEEGLDEMCELLLGDAVLQF
jgi:hypothetical protein